MLLLPNEARGPGHFCLTLHVAMQLGLYLPGRFLSLVWRAVSEGSRRVGESSLLIVRTRRIFTAGEFVGE